MESNVIEGRTIDKWNFEVADIDCENNDYARLWGDFFVEGLKDNDLTFYVEPSYVDIGEVSYGSDRYDGYNYDYASWERHPKVEVKPEDIELTDGGAPLSLEQFINKAGITSEQLEEIKAQLCDFAEGEFECYLEENYDELYGE